MQNDELVPERISHLTAVNSPRWRRTAIAIVITAIITGASGYLLGVRNMQLPPAPQPTPPSSRAIPTTQLSATLSHSSVCTPSPIPRQPTSIINWKTYTNENLGFSFQYPETWFPQEIAGWNPPGESINFYQNQVTPHSGQAGDPTTAILNVQVSSNIPRTTEQFISTASKTPGYQRILNIAGKPAVQTKLQWFRQYYIKLDDTRLLLLTMYDEDEGKELDAIVSSINFASE